MCKTGTCRALSMRRLLIEDDQPIESVRTFSRLLSSRMAGCCSRKGDLESCLANQETTNTATTVIVSSITTHYSTSSSCASRFLYGLLDTSRRPLRCCLRHCLLPHRSLPEILLRSSIRCNRVITRYSEIWSGRRGDGLESIDAHIAICQAQIACAASIHCQLQHH